MRERIPTRASQILSYFVRHPRAVDSLEGVVRWRLLEESVQRNVTEVDAALRWLVAKRFLLEDVTVGIDPVFRVNRERVDDALRLLARSRKAGTRSGRSQETW